MKRIQFYISFFFISYLFAIPATQNLITYFQPSGEEIVAKLKGDEWHHWVETEAGYTIAQNRDGVWKYVESIDNNNEYSLSGIDAQLKVPLHIAKHIQQNPRFETPNHQRENPVDLSQLTREEFEIPLVLVDFPNMPHSYPPSDFDDLMNQEGYAGYQGETGSFRDLYIENSYGQFIPNTSIIGWFTADNEYQVYGDAAPNGYGMVKQMIGIAIDEAEAQGVDWSVFDNDNDGYVDALNVLHAGQGAEEGNTSYIWSHKWNLGNEARYYDGVVIDNYTINPEKQAIGNGPNPGMVHIGVISHEFGHALGLPDLYDTDYSSSGIGTWGLMSGGSWGGNGSSPWYPAHFCAWSKVRLGWIDPIVVSEGSFTAELSSVEENPVVYKMFGTGEGQEYFMFENRQAIGFDQTIKNTGLLIWHIDDAIGGNSDDWHRRVDVEQADGYFDLNYGSNDGDAADIWPGILNKTYFGFDTAPNSTYYNDSPSGISVVDIVESDETVWATFRNLPNLSINNIQFTETNGDYDSVPNPGETHNLTIEFYNPSDSDIFGLEMVISSENSNITILHGNSDLDDISGYGNTENNVDIQIEISQDAPLEAAELNVYFTGVMASGDEFDQNLILPINIRLDQQGFPTSVGSEVKNSPALIDLNDDGNKEIIVIDDVGIAYAIKFDGTFYENWQIDVGDEVWGAPVIADVDSDGELEIIIASKSKHLFVISKDGNIELSYDADQFLVSTPSVANLDDDDDLEIVFGGMSNSGKLFAINHDGSPINSNFPISVDEKIYTGVSIADINNDGQQNLVCTTKSGFLHVYKLDGTELENFPFEAEDDIRSAPISVDVDFDGEIEILFGDDNGVFYSVNPNGEVDFIYESNGSIRSSPSVEFSNGGVHIYFGNNAGELISLDASGNLREGWPITFANDLTISPVFADIDSDDEYEVYISSYNRGVVLTNSGDILHEFNLPNGATSSSSPLLFDIDYDLDLEFIYGYSDGVSCIDFKAQNHLLGQWKMFRGNPHRTGHVDFLDGVVMGDVNTDGYIDIIDIIFQINHITNHNLLSGISLVAADLNIDGVINVQDILLIVNIIISE